MIEDLKSILIDKSATVIDAMKQLEGTAEKILFVVDQNYTLIGSLTDGDIRRWILSEGNLDVAVDEPCFKGTYYVKTKHDLNIVKREILKRRIHYVPVVDKLNRVVEFLIWDQLFDGNLIRKTKRKLDTPIVIMAGGKGTRLDPFTKILPKALIPIGAKSIIEVIIDKFSEYNVNNFYVSVNHKAKIIKSYFEELQHDYKLTFIEEDKPLGTVGALKKLDGKVEGNIILTNCDIIIDCDYADLLDHHIDVDNDLTLVASVKNYKIPYGVCEVKGKGEVIDVKEKPEYNFLVSTGMYVLKSNIIKHIPENEHYDITQLMEKIKKMNYKIGIYPISENSWIDTGDWKEYKKALEKINI